MLHTLWKMSTGYFELHWIAAKCFIQRKMLNHAQAYEVLEIFLELLTVRLQLIESSKDIPNDMFECLASLVYSASRIQASSLPT